MADAREHSRAHITPCRAKTHFFKDLDLSTVLEPPSDVGVCGTQIICSIGPSCQSIEMLCALLRAGMSVARIDLTWGPLEYHLRSLDNLQLVRSVAAAGCSHPEAGCLAAMPAPPCHIFPTNSTMSIKPVPHGLQRSMMPTAIAPSLQQNAPP
jgi:hypothetical protein